MHMILGIHVMLIIVGEKCIDIHFWFWFNYVKYGVPNEHNYYAWNIFAAIPKRALSKTSLKWNFPFVKL